MAILTRGKLKGTEVKIRQWCNDWFMVDDGTIVSPGSIQLNKEEIDKVKAHKNNGILFNLYILKENGTFIKRKAK